MTQNVKKVKKTFTSLSTSKTADTTRLINVITDALLEKKAEDITLLDVRDLTTLADTFIVCHADTDIQIKAIANNVIDRTKEDLGEKVWKSEGMDSRRWVVLDYVNVVVHLFRKEQRDFYAIERMWNDAEVTKVKDEP